MSIKITYPNENFYRDQSWWDALPFCTFVRGKNQTQEVVVYKPQRSCEFYLTFYAEGQGPYLVKNPWTVYRQVEVLPRGTTIDIRFNLK